MWIQRWLKDDIQKVTIKSYVWECLAEYRNCCTVAFNFLNNDLEVDGSDLVTFTSGITV